MSEKKYYWLKLQDDFFTQREIKKLRKIAGGDTYTIIYLKLQLLSLQYEGRLYFEGIEDNFVEEMALTLDEEAENVKVTLLYLQKYGLIEETNTDEFLLPKTAMSIGSETSGAERVRRFRSNQKALQSNSNVIIGNAEKRRDKEEIENKEDKKPKKIAYAEFVSMTEEEYNKLIKEHGQALTTQMITTLDNYKGSSGKKYKSDYRTILNWVVDRVKQNQPTKATNSFNFEGL